MGSRAVRVLAIAAGSAVALYLPTAATGAPDDPPGNNGTVKIDGVPFDDHPDNEPHVGCTFHVDFYGYDQGDLDAGVTFESHPPTGPVHVLLTDTVFIGEDSNAGGGSEAGHDASETYTLSFTGIEPHPNQGFHVKLTINAEGSQGADVKHKVFWVTGCGVAPTTTSTSSTTTSSTTTSSTSTSTSTSTSSTSTTGTTSTTSSTTSTTQVLGTTATTSGTTSTTAATTSTTGATTSTTAPAVAGVSVTQTTPTTPTTAQVLGVQVERAPTRPTSLARTGLPLVALTLVGVALVLAGQAARQRARR